MKYEFWKDIKVGDLLYYYDTDNFNIGHFYIKDIKEKSAKTGSFILETDCDKHKLIYVLFANFLINGHVSTWNHTTCKELFININKHELYNQREDELKKKINQLQSNLDHYKNLLLYK